MFPAFKFSSFFASGLLLFSSSAPILREAKEAIVTIAIKLQREHHAPYTDSPTAPYRGEHPGRDTRTRGGLWTEQQLMEHANEGLSADAEAFAGGTLGPTVSPSAGYPLPWEGPASSAGGVAKHCQW